MSEISDCPYRDDAHGEGDAEEARCRLVEQLSSPLGPEPCRVGRAMCEACCHHPAPSPDSLNPVVASLLFLRALDVQNREDAPPVLVQKATTIRRTAELGLLRIESPAQPVPLNEGPCFHLGGRIGLRECPTCGGSVRVKVFACHHLLHQETTLKECATCPDFDARLRRDGVKTWAVGVTTAPRAEPTLGRCLRSLAAAGWDAPRLFAEPGADVPLEFARLPTTHRGETLGEWPNWFLGLAELVHRAPEADAYMMVQDDVVFCRNTRAFVEAEMWPGPRVGIVSVYCPEPYARGDDGWSPVDTRQGMVSALTCIFPSAAARALLADPGLVNYRQRGPLKGLVDTDGVLGRWAGRTGMPVYFHSPSLAQHVGDTSSVWPGAENSGVRHSNNFLGEDFDALGLLSRPAPAGDGGPAPPVAESVAAPTAIREEEPPLAPSGPPADREGAAATDGWLVDCLDRAEIHLPTVPLKARRCVATVVTPGFAGLLDDLLGSLRANGGRLDARVVVFAIDPDRECRWVAAKHGATLVPCVRRSVANAALKSVLYSAARVVDAERFVCLDADMVVLGDLGPIFAALDACPEGAILAARETNGPAFPDLRSALGNLYGASPEEAASYLGGWNGEADYPLVVNDGIFAGGRAAMRALDETIRRMPEAPAWVDERADVPWRNQFVFNLALARLGCGVELAPSYNIQLNRVDVEWDVEEGRATALWRGAPARVLHYLGAGREKDRQWRSFAAHGAETPGAAPNPDGLPKNGDGWDAASAIDLAKVLAAVVVYDRHATVSTWLRCWDASYRGTVTLAVCHTLPADRLASAAIRLAGPDLYVPLEEEGGQDVAALRRLIRSAPGDWEALFWCTDDVLPMRRDFLRPFLERMSADVGLVGLHLIAPWHSDGPAGRVYEHVRTVAFLIRREVAERLTFPEDGAGKRGCYEFEHADPVGNMTAQVRALGYRVASVHGIGEFGNDVMWDVGHVGVHVPADVDDLWRKFSAQWGLNRPARVVHDGGAGRSENPRGRTVVACGAVGPSLSVAVVVLCHNYGLYLAEAIESALKQTRPPAEILVVDDASDDDTREVAARYAPRGVRYLMVDHRDVHLTRRAGFEATTADVLCFLDGDDRLAPDYLEHGLARFADRRLGIVYSDMRLFGDVEWTFAAPEFDPALLSRQNYIHSAALVTRQSLLISRALDAASGEQARADWRLWLRVIEAGFLAAKSHSWLEYRKHAGSMLESSILAAASYSEGAGLARAVVTIFTPLAGRRSAWGPYSAWLEAQSWPRDQCRLVLCDTSQDGDYHALVRAWAASSDYSDVRLYQQSVGERGLAEKDRYSHEDLVTLSCRRIYARMSRELQTPFAMVVEDDVVPPPDAIDRLMRSMDVDVGAVAGAYLSRFESVGGYVCWEKDGEPIRPAGEGVIEIGGSGFGCLLVRKCFLDGETFAWRPGDPKYYDVAFSNRVRERGGRWLLDLGCRADHLAASEGRGLPAAPRILVLAHVFHEELWNEIAENLCRLERPFDLHVNAVLGQVSPGWERTVRDEFPGARVHWSENRGLDVGGTIALLAHVELSRYDLVCKVHTKKSQYNPPLGTSWRRELLRALFDDPDAVAAAFDDPEVAMVASRQWIEENLTVNRDNCVALGRRFGLDDELVDGAFVAGSMFWCRPFVLQAIKDAGLSQAEFEAGYERDGALAHAVERAFGMLARSRGRIVGR